mgnify:CR=1 FL=1
MRIQGGGRGEKEAYPQVLSEFEKEIATPKKMINAPLEPYRPIISSRNSIYFNSSLYLYPTKEAFTQGDYIIWRVGGTGTAAQDAS